MSDYQIEGKRLLEVDCGITLASLLLNHRHADITATNYHLKPETFFRQVVNSIMISPYPSFALGWGDEDSGLGRFDLIIDSDLLYERGHAELLSNFINRHAKPHCEVIIVDPGRSHHTHVSRQMMSPGYSHSQSRPDNINYLAKTLPREQILRYQR